MNIFSQNHNRPAVVRKLALLLVSLGALAVSGCDSPDASDGTRYEAIILPTDTLLNLACADVGIFDNTCVLEDPENPFATVAIIEFDENNPEDAISLLSYLNREQYGDRPLVRGNLYNAEVKDIDYG